MPNWCNNMVTLRHTDKAKIDALEAEMSKKGADGYSAAQPFNHLFPNPSGEWDYNWSVENWGTKWDANVIDWERQDENTIWISFDSAWSPPTVLYQDLVDSEWEVDALYYEPGMAFAGKFTTDYGDECYEYDITDMDSIEELPEDVIEFANLREEAQDWLDNNSDNEEKVG